MTWSGLKERRNKHGWAERWRHKFFIRPYSSRENINAFFGNLPPMHKGWKLPPISTRVPSLLCCCHCLMRMLQRCTEGKFTHFRSSDISPAFSGCQLLVLMLLLFLL